ncbi:MAG: 2-oxoglutarate ferredoxin oxidoreductase subunit alpha, partial [Bradymonadia bacterium]
MNDRTDNTPPPETVDSVVVRFAGDSGDGMQLTGARFTEANALAGNDVATLPDYPAEIRAPAGTVGGVSGFQVQFADHRVFTPGDQPDVLVAMNPAALNSNLKDLPTGGTIVLDEDSFSARAITKAGFSSDPRKDGTLDAFKVFEVPISKATLIALEDVNLTKREKERSKNFFALGLAFWMFDRPLDGTLAWISTKFGADTPAGVANRTALQKGYDFGVTAEIAPSRMLVSPAAIPDGHYRSITGNTAIALGVATVAHLAKRPVVYAGYPITPASDILHELARLKAHGIETIQAEDEIAACCMAIGASYGGALGVTASSGPGIVLKGEAIGLAAATELPLVIINVQR